MRLLFKSAIILVSLVLITGCQQSIPNVTDIRVTYSESGDATVLWTESADILSVQLWYGEKDGVLIQFTGTALSAGTVISGFEQGKIYQFKIVTIGILNIASTGTVFEKEFLVNSIPEPEIVIDENAIYVSSSFSSGLSDGTHLLPYTNITDAMDAFDSSINSKIILSNETYIISKALSIIKDVTVVGGYNHTTWAVTDDKSKIIGREMTKTSIDTFSPTLILFQNDHDNDPSTAEYSNNIDVNFLNIDFYNETVDDDLDSCILLIDTTATDLNISIDDCILKQNSSTEDGGGIIAFSGTGTLSISDTVFNQCTQNMIYNEINFETTIVNCDFFVDVVNYKTPIALCGYKPVIFKNNKIKISTGSVVPEWYYGIQIINTNQIVFDSNMIFTDSDADLANFYPIFTASEKLIFSNNIFSLYKQSTGVITCAAMSGPNNSVFNNTFYINDANALADNTLIECASPNLNAQNNLYFEQNGSLATSTSKFVLFYTDQTLNATVDTNSFYISAGIGSNILMHNDSVNPAESIDSLHTGNFSNQPSFTDVLIQDFSLKSDNHINILTGGNDLSSIFTVDYYGVTRTVPWSLGAIKY